MSNSKSLAHLYRLWMALGDIPVGPEVRGAELVTCEPFEHFPAGTSVERIWHWFEGQHSGFSVAKVQHGELFGEAGGPLLHILEVSLLDHLPSYDNPEVVAGWEWVRQQARFAHVGNNIEPGVWEFLVSVKLVLDDNVVFDSIPDKLLPFFIRAKNASAAWILFHQG